MALPDPGPRRRSTGAAVIGVLYDGGYDGVVSVEHEDPVWSGDPDRVSEGLDIAARTLTPLLVDPSQTAR